MKGRKRMKRIRKKIKFAFNNRMRRLRMKIEGSSSKRKRRGIKWA
jgi:hypothetical protein